MAEEKKKKPTKESEQVLVDKEFLGEITGAYTELSKKVGVLSEKMEKFGISQIDQKNNIFFEFYPLIYYKGEFKNVATPEQIQESEQRALLFRKDLYELMKKYRIGRIRASILKRL